MGTEPDSDNDLLHVKQGAGEGEAVVLVFSYASHDTYVMLNSLAVPSLLQNSFHTTNITTRFHSFLAFKTVISLTTVVGRR
jgi:hypothetical protein